MISITKSYDKSAWCNFSVHCHKYLDTRLFLIGLLVLPFWAVVSCQNDDDDAIPVIHYIRVTDPAKADSTFTDVNPGTGIM